MFPQFPHAKIMESRLRKQWAQTGWTLSMTWLFRVVPDVAVADIEVRSATHVIQEDIEQSVTDRKKSSDSYPFFQAGFANISQGHDVLCRWVAPALKHLLECLNIITKNIAFGQSWEEFGEDPDAQSWEGWCLATVERLYGAQGKFGTMTIGTRRYIEGDEGVGVAP